MSRARWAGLGLLYLVPLSLYSRLVVSAFEERAGELGLGVTFWDVVLVVLRHPFTLVYWVLPAALWVVLVRVTRRHYAEHLIRYPSRTSWMFARMVDGAAAGGLLLAGLTWVAVVLAVPYPFQWSWSAAAASAEVAESYAELLPTADLPVLAAVVQLVAAVLTVTAAAGLIAGVCVLTGGRVGWVVLTTVVLAVGGIASFRWSGPISASVGPATYLVNTQAERYLPWGAAGPLLLLPLAMGVGVAISAHVERRRAAGRRQPRREVWLGAVLLGGFALAAWYAQAYARTPAEFFVALHAGPSPQGLSLVPFLTWALLTLGPALAVMARVADHLEGTLHQELVRAGSPVRWWRPLAIRAAGFNLAYVLILALATVGLATLAYRDSPLPPAAIVCYFTVAATMQITVYCAVLFLALWGGGTAAAAAAVGGSLVLALPPVLALGILPSGLSALGGPGAVPTDWTPVLVLTGWLVVLIAATLIMLRLRPAADR